MKQSIVCVATLITSLSVAAPVNLQDRSSIGLDSAQTPTILPRAVMRAVGGPPRQAPLRASAIPSGAQAAPRRPLNGGHSRQQSTARPSRRLSATHNANGVPAGHKPNIPDAEATAETASSGIIGTNSGKNMNAKANTVKISSGPGDKQKIKDPNGVYASAISTDFRGGSRLTASGRHSVKATMQNGKDTVGCIECQLPGQDPIRMTSGPGKTDEPIVMTAKNKNPDAGPIKVSVTQGGEGQSSVEAWNTHPLP